MKQLARRTLLILAISIMTISFTGCYVSQRTTIKGDKNKSENIYNLSDSSYTIEIDEIFVKSSSNRVVGAYLNVDNTFSNGITVSSDQNILDTITVIVDDTKNLITIKGSTDVNYYTENITIDIGAKVNKISIDGGMALNVAQGDTESFMLNIDGACDGDIKITKIGKLTLDIDGASDLTLEGNADLTTINIDGASNIDASSLISNNTKIQLNGAGACSVNTIYNLDANINGMGMIEYVGTPETIEKSINGLGSVKQK